MGMLPALCWRGEKETSFFVREPAVHRHVCVCGGGQGSELQEIGQGAKQRGGTPITALLMTFLLSERGGEDIFESVKKMEERDKKRKKKKGRGKRLAEEHRAG